MFNFLKKEQKCTFKAKKKAFIKGSKRYELHKQVKTTLHSGSQALKQAVILPEGEDLNEWLAVHTTDFFNQISNLYSYISEFCTSASCEVMSAGPKYEYLWADGEKVKKPIRVSAPEYISYLMEWTKGILDNEEIFPTLETSIFPKNFKDTVKNIFKKLFRVYAHIYYSHFDKIVSFGEESHLNSCFKHFYYFICEFNLVSKQEMEPLSELITQLTAKDGDNVAKMNQVDQVQRPNLDRAGTFVVNNNFIEVIRSVSTSQLSENDWRIVEQYTKKNPQANLSGVLGDRELEILAYILEKNYSLFLLVISSNKLNESKLELLINALKNNTNLGRLDVSKNLIQNRGADLFGHYLEKNPPLIELNISYNNIDSGIFSLVSGLSTNSHLITLILNNNNIGSDGLVSLCGALENNKTLKNLNLKFNNIVTGLAELAKVLKSGSQLEYLNLSHNELDKSTLPILFEALASNHALLELDLSYVPMTGEAIAALGKSLKQNNTLKSLYLEYCHIEDDHIVDIVNGLSLNNTLSYLNLKMNDIEEPGALVLYSLDKENKHLKLLLEKHPHELCKSLLEGSDISKLTRNGNTALHLICMIGDYKLAVMLLNHGADPSLKNINGQTCKDVSTEKCKDLFTEIKQLKVVVVGNASAGKTTLIRRIIDDWSLAEKIRTQLLNKGERKVTDGIEMHEWSPPFDSNMTIRLWDFAGQEMFQVTHQFFLSENGITILVFRLNEELTEGKLGFWLNSIQYRAPKSKVLIVGTFLDQIEGKQAQEKVILISKSIEVIFNELTKNIGKENERITLIKCPKWRMSKQKPFIEETISFWPINTISKEPVGVYELTQVLETFSISHTVQLNLAELSQSIVKLRGPSRSKSRRNNLTKSGINPPEILKSKFPIMDRHELDELIESHFGEQCSTENKFRIRKELQALGFILDFGGLELNKIIIDPQWLADVFRCIIGLKNKDIIKNGIIEKSAIIQNLKDGLSVDQETGTYLIEFLEAFEIFMNHPTDSRSIVIPFLLSSTKSKEIEQDWKSFLDLKKCIGITFAFPFLPCGMLNKLICGLCKSEKPNSVAIRFWGNGILLSKEKGHLLLEVLNVVGHQEIRVKTTGDSYHLLIQSFEFTLMELIKSEYPLLTDKFNRSIYFYHSNQEFIIPFKDFLEKQSRGENFILDNRFVVSPSEIWPMDSSSLKHDQSDFQTANMIRGAILGRGATADVFKCKFDKFHGTYVVKEFKVNSSNISRNEKIRNCFETELKIMQQLKHPNVISLLGFKKNLESFSLIVEYYDTSLRTLIYPHYEKWEDSKVLTVSTQILNGLTYLHKLFIAHLDMKLENILVEFTSNFNSSSQQWDSNFCVRITDFGIAKQLADINSNIEDCVGTPGYMAPEITSERKPYNPFLADVYSFGIIFCEIRFGSKHLNPEKNKGDKFLKVILSCCETNPAKRPFTSQIENLF